MLVNTLIEFSSGLEYPDGTRHDAAWISTKKRLSGAQVYILDRDAVAMAANVSLSKPSSILSALPWVRLPFATTWIEFTNNDVRDSMADLGSPNLHAPGPVSRLIHSGFLLSREADFLLFAYVHLFIPGANS